MSLDIYFITQACEHCGCSGHTEFDANFTHNMTPLWRFLGCYDALYLSDGKRVAEVLPELTAAMARLRERSDAQLVQFDAPNGWGTINAARPWLERLYAAAVAHPQAVIRVRT